MIEKVDAVLCLANINIVISFILIKNNFTQVIRIFIKRYKTV